MPSSPTEMEAADDACDSLELRDIEVTPNQTWLIYRHVQRYPAAQNLNGSSGNLTRYPGPYATRPRRDVAPRLLSPHWLSDFAWLSEWPHLVRETKRPGTPHVCIKTRSGRFVHDYPDWGRRVELERLKLTSKMVLILSSAAQFAVGGLNDLDKYGR
ncbi:hypothetical protein OIDMADRAFT_34795 [Oidiodendron maius Zn]|uniref:Uncharacterized protein n=1 Tax=Oidiodendron maius (strain Zn) TaxID=913774 RepID=A0A0C3GWX1_OIDMZ|nr:hypothetical protein OIDMADRAFT_34795 [Oidiodendron maius Zn]